MNAPCPAEETVLAYVAGGLAPDVVDSVDDHLDSCPSCRRLLLLVAKSPSLDATTPAGDLALSPTAPGEPKRRSDPTLPPGLPRGAQIGRYVVTDVLGQGGMGTVYAAFDPELDRKIAVKVLRPGLAGEQATTRLLREGRAIARLAHPNVVTVFDVGTHAAGEGNASVFVAMELVDGTSLDKWLETPRPWRDVVEIFVQAGRGLIAAHDAGIIHRDFKPANVLVGADGRVRVTDFGLARLDASERISRPDGALSDELELTRTGAVMGTPAYMAPEQFDAKPVDERTDQFSFAVALYEGLYGARPFQATTAIGIYEQIVGGKIAAPARSTVPARLRPLVVRGLAADPDARYGKLAELLAALEATRKRRTSVWIAAAAVPVLAIGAFALTRSGADVCAGAGAKIAGVWNATTRAQMQQAFVATNKPYAAGAFANVAGALDRYTSNWADAHVDACRATVRKEQSEELLDLRMTCLEQRRAELRAIVDVLAHADAAVVEHAGDMITRGGTIAQCADLTALRAPVALPASPAIRGQVDELRGELSRGLALSDAGKDKEAIKFVPAIVASARALKYQPLEADALIVLGSLQFETGDQKAATASLRAAVVAAEASGHQLAAAKAWRGLVITHGLGAGDYSSAVDAADHARAILGRLDPDGLEMADFQSTLSTVLREKGDFGPAREAATKAIAIFERKLPAGDAKIARAYNNLGNIEWFEGHPDKAIAIFLRVRDDLVRTLGAQHPMVGKAYGNLSGAYRDAGKYAEAVAANKQDLAIAEAALGPEHPELVKSLNQMGNIAADQGRDDDAIAAYTRALAIAQKAYGDDHPYVSALLVNIAILEGHHNKLADARAHLDRALRIDEKRLGPDNIGLVSTLGTLADLAIDQGKLDEARQFADREMAIKVKAFGPDNESVAKTWVTIANIASAANKPAESIADLKKALAIQDKPALSKTAVAITLYNLGNQLYTNHDYEAAEVAMRRAVSIYEQAFGPDHKSLADMLTVLAAIVEKRGHVNDAAPMIERALAIREKGNVQPRQLAETQSTAARILWQTSPDHTRAIKLAQQAIGVLATAEGAKEQHDTLAAWMKSKGIR